MANPNLDRLMGRKGPRGPMGGPAAPAPSPTPDQAFMSRLRDDPANASRPGAYSKPTPTPALRPDINGPGYGAAPAATFNQPRPGGPAPIIGPASGPPPAPARPIGRVLLDSNAIPGARPGPAPTPGPTPTTAPPATPGQVGGIAGQAQGPGQRLAGQIQSPIQRVAGQIQTLASSGGRLQAPPPAPMAPSRRAMANQANVRSAMQGFPGQPAGQPSLKGQQVAAIRQGYNAANPPNPEVMGNRTVPFASKPSGPNFQIVPPEAPPPRVAQPPPPVDSYYARERPGPAPGPTAVRVNPPAANVPATIPRSTAPPPVDPQFARERPIPPRTTGVLLNTPAANVPAVRPKPTYSTPPRGPGGATFPPPPGVTPRGPAGAFNAPPVPPVAPAPAAGPGKMFPTFGAAAAGAKNGLGNLARMPVGQAAGGLMNSSLGRIAGYGARLSLPMVAASAVNNLGGDVVDTAASLSQGRGIATGNGHGDESVLGIPIGKMIDDLGSLWQTGHPEVPISRQSVGLGTAAPGRENSMVPPTSTEDLFRASLANPGATVNPDGRGGVAVEGGEPQADGFMSVPPAPTPSAPASQPAPQYSGLSFFNPAGGEQGDDAHHRMLDAHLASMRDQLAKMAPRADSYMSRQQAEAYSALAQAYGHALGEHYQADGHVAAAGRNQEPAELVNARINGINAQAIHDLRPPEPKPDPIAQTQQLLANPVALEQMYLSAGRSPAEARLMADDASNRFMEQQADAKLPPVEQRKRRAKRNLGNPDWNKKSW